MKTDSQGSHCRLELDLLLFLVERDLEDLVDLRDLDDFIDLTDRSEPRCLLCVLSLILPRAYISTFP